MFLSPELKSALRVLPWRQQIMAAQVGVDRAPESFWGQRYLPRMGKLEPHTPRILGFLGPRLERVRLLLKR